MNPGLSMNRGILRAGGNAVHRVVGQRRTPLDPDAPPPVDTVPLIDRYTDLAMSMHRIAVVPVRERFAWGCTCGGYAKTPILGREKAMMVARQHVLDMAQEMMDTLEGPEETDEPN